MINKKAFTLAEVLITLPIIGVIAALTIPNLMQSYKKHQIETNLKAAYTILSNAITIAQSKYGSLQEMADICYSNSAKDKANCFTDNYLKPNLKYSKSCDCEDFTCKEVFSVDNLKALDGTISNAAIYIPKYYATLKLNNGILIGVQWWSQAGPYFIADVNGSAGPNKIGTDVFYFTLNEDEGERNHLTSGLRCGSSYYDPVKYSWTINCVNKGEACSCPIMYNGWKIPDNYPVKKF